MSSARSQIGDFLEAVDSGVISKEEIDRNLEAIDQPQSRNRALAGVELLNILGSMNSQDEIDLGDSSETAASLRKAIKARKDGNAILCDGIKIERYELIEQLGRGGYGAVFRAVDTLLDRIVALKIPAILVVADDDSHQRFLKEARLAAQLKHPNIVSVYGAGSDSGIWYIVSEYCHGPNLAQVIADPKLLDRSNHEQRLSDTDTTLTDQESESSSLPARTAASIVADLAAAVAHAHDRGVIHRDIKPANVMIDYGSKLLQPSVPSDDEGYVPKLTDFGLAKLMEDQDVTLTASGARVGTVAYMAPEQVDSGKSQVGFGADIYGLGNLLYELLTGEAPFGHGTDLKTLNAIRAEDPPRPRLLNSRIPAPLEAITMRCLEKSSEDRFGSAAEIEVALRTWLDGNADGRGVFGNWPSRRRRQFRAAYLAFATFVVALLIAGATAFLPDSIRQSVADITGISVLQPDPLRNIQQQLVTHLPLKHDLLDATGNEIHASVGGGDPRFTTDVGPAIELDGKADYLTLGDHENLRFEGQDGFTVCGWIFLIGDQAKLRNMNPFSSGVDVTVIGSHRMVNRFTRLLTDSVVYEDTTDTAGWGLELVGGSEVRVIASNGERYRATQMRGLDRNRWVFFCLVFNLELAETKFWIDDEVTDYFPIPPGTIDAFANGHSINIGQDGTGKARDCMRARVRNLTIWQRALEDRETLALYQFGMERMDSLLLNQRE